MLLKEIKNVLNEEALNAVIASDLWAEQGADAIEYRNAATYMVRQVKDSDPAKFEAFKEKDLSKRYGLFTKQELGDMLQPIRPNQQPDVEGFTTYVDPGRVEAFKYTGDPLKITLGKEGGVRLNKGDYLIRTAGGNDFTYSTEPGSQFDSMMVKA